MAKEDILKIDGEVVEILPSTMFRVKIPDFDVLILATISGRVRKNNIKILLGDSVTMELSPYDMSRGRIVRRL
jgi:translation initiation factor IF-1